MDDIIDMTESRFDNNDDNVSSKSFKYKSKENSNGNNNENEMAANIRKSSRNSRNSTASTISSKSENSGSSASNSSDNEQEASSDSTINEDTSQQTNKIRIGEEHQANLTNFFFRQNRNDVFEKETLIWNPQNNLSDSTIDEFLSEASDKFSYTIEQGLALLFINRYDLNRTYNDLKYTYIPKPNEWSKEDNILFEQAYMGLGKNFNKIRQVLPDKSQSDLVNYYYTWKKTRSYISSMDQQLTASKNSNSNSNNNYETNGDGIEYKSNGNSELNSVNNNGIFSNDNMDQSDAGESENESNEDTSSTNICCNCDIITSELLSTPKGMLCSPCYTYWRNTGGLMRPDHLINKQRLNDNSSSHYKSNRLVNNTDQDKMKNFHKVLRKPPKGIYLNYDELVSMADSNNDQIFEVLNRRLLSLKKKVQKNKQNIQNYNILISKVSSEIANVSLDEQMLQLESEPIPEWTPKEIALVIQGFNKYGDEFEAISQVIGTKTEGSIKAFYNYYKENLNLDKLILNCSKELTQRANQTYNTLNKLNLPELPVDSTTVSNLNTAAENEKDKSVKSSSALNNLNFSEDVIFITND